ncbi:DUF4129 domain-containing protein [Methanospirillum hungatei]|uniref:DUF4129 domain-containing protein n=1 Tax=Methanospirillum hungatei TaxID=2203 RepID=UPI0026F126A1|nr:DUF4129 domain-containing protein [Methanospirillum hungatei]MCA1917024.1 DUF4129 domain-containing protein [Methanospirillum hungatei]
MNSQGKRHLFYLVYASLCLLVAGLLIGNGMQPLLYPAEKGVRETGYHMNIGDLRKQAFNSSTDLLPLMQELLDYSGTIAVTLRKSDLESASSDLARYTSRYHDLQNLIIKLDMNESEIARFAQDAGQQKDMLSQFVSTSESLQSLEKLEIQYQDKGDPDSVTKVRLQGKALKNRIQTLQNQYADVTDSLSSRGNALGVNTDPVMRSRTEFDTLTGMVAERQNERDRTTRFADAGSPFISFLAGPNNVTFQEKVNVYGFIAGSQDRSWPVVINLDNNPFLELKPDDIGEFRSTVQIHTISAGEHTLTARWGAVISEPSRIVVPSLETTLGLRVLPVKGMSAVNLTGTLTARDPVPDVPVSILVQDKVCDTVMTNVAGTYLVTMPLSAGTYHVFTRFDDPSYPLLPSESQHYIVESDGNRITSVTSSKAGSIPPWILVLPGILLFTIPIWYFWRKGIVQRFDSQDEVLSKLKDTPDQWVGGDADDGMIDSAIIPAAQYPPGPEELPRRIYLEVLSSLSRHQVFQISPFMTPREIAGALPDEVCKARFTRFIGWYERIRYGGCQDFRCMEGLKHAADRVRKSCPERRDEG